MPPVPFLQRQLACERPNCRCVRGGPLHTAFRLSVLLGGKVRTFHNAATMPEEVPHTVEIHRRFQTIAAKTCQINLRQLPRR